MPSFKALALSLLRITEPAAGSITIDGVDIAKIGLRDLRERVVSVTSANRGRQQCLICLHRPLSAKNRPSSKAQVELKSQDREELLTSVYSPLEPGPSRPVLGFRDL
jgi:hypothetical protein